MIDYLPSLVLLIPIVFGAVMLYVLISLLNLLRKINTKLDILINNK